MTSKIHLVIPDLFLPQQFSGAACSGLTLPSLEKILARSVRESIPAQSLEAWLCGHFGVADGAIAPITLRADGLQPEGFYWLRADPVHLQWQRAHFMLRADWVLSVDEAAQLCDSLNHHFAAEGLQFFAPHPQRWYVRLEAAPDLMTQPLMQVVGKNIRPYLPSGADALHWHGVLNEAQMLLHEHAVNVAREARGEVAINSVWLWGGGHAPEKLKQPFAGVWGDSPLASAFAHAANIPYADLDIFNNGSDNNAWLKNVSGEVLVVWEGLRQAIQQGDLHSWQRAARSLEQHCAMPLLKALSDGNITQLTLDVLHSSASQRFILTRSDVWKLWRLPVSLTNYALK